jgi:nucleoside-diphosphate-sugar epimerase
MSTWALTGGGGFLGSHLADRLVANGHVVRTLDREPLDQNGPEADVERVLGDVRDPARARQLCRGADVLVHAAAALPIRRSREEIWSVNVKGTEVVVRAAATEGVRRVVYVSSTAVYGVPSTHPITEETPLDPLGAYGASKIEAERVCSAFARNGIEVVILRPKTFIGRGRLGVFEILFEWIREGRKIYVIGSGRNRYQLLAVEDLVDAIVRSAERPTFGTVLNLGAKTFGTVREDLGALIGHAGSSSTIMSLPARPTQAILRMLELARLSPLAEWHYRTADRDSFVDLTRAEQVLGWTPRFSNVDALVASYDWFVANEAIARAVGTTHRTAWRQQALGLLKRFS